MNIFLAVPCLDGKVTWECAESLLRATHILRDRGHSIVPYGLPRYTYLDRARNICVYNFLRSDCDELIFIDSDVGFDGDSLLKLIKHDKDIVAGAYPYKQDKIGFPVALYFDPNTNNCKEESTGLATAEKVPTGTLRIKRSVFQQMSDYYDLPVDHEGVTEYFKTGMIFPEDNTWYGEDIAFCKRWTAMGGKLFVEPDIDFIHTGIKNYKGNYYKHLMGGGSVSLDVGESKIGIPGWMTDRELFQLRVLAAQSSDIVEVGSWKGRSTRELLETCSGTVYVVDHWLGSKNDASCIKAASEDVHAEFVKNVGHYPNLKVLRGDSVAMAGQFNGTKVDMVFIDAGHSYEECKADIDAWLPKCKKIICGHDYHLFPGVTNAVNEKFSELVQVVDTLWFVNLHQESEKPA